MVKKIVMLVKRIIKNKIRQFFPDPKIVNKLSKKLTNQHGVKNIILMDLPTNGNLGDQALVYAAKEFIHSNISTTEINIIEVPNNEINSSIKFLSENLRSTDIVVWNGGGNLGTIYPTAELSRWATFKALRMQQVIMFPQSVFYNPLAKKFLNTSVHFYNNKANLSVYLREKNSYDFFSKNFSVAQIELVPDIVFSLENKLPINISEIQNRNGIITLLRRDKEKSDFDNDKLITLLSKVDSVTQSDTYIDNIEVSNSNRNQLLVDKWTEIAQHKLVVTDRLHGVIFAYLTKTPALVIPNNNWKIESTYETWLSGAPFIEILGLNEMTDYAISSKVEKLMSMQPHYLKISSNFEPLVEKIEEIGK
ncbi:polysaccharide pyruvyl transferase family protein [Leuconostoc suionicum]|uniref:polysaccharide pyruvyl transferase family protein n=1 Tax=Leuconostoc suionicum TaxID=1511761 RepID=UPI0039748A45